MNIKKLSNSFSAPINSDRFSDYIQNARVNEELKKMNEEISFDYMKNMLNEMFSNNTDYEVFNREIEIKRARRIIIPSKDSNSIWNEKCFAYWNPKNYATFAVFPANEEEKNYYNCSFYIFSRGKVDFKENITFANQINDIRDKIEFYIQSFSFLQDDEIKVNFNDLEFEYDWYNYSNMINLTEDCIKKFDSKELCKKENCENCNKCKNYYPLIDYTKNHYNANKLFNKFIEVICKEYKLPAEIIASETGYVYNIGDINIQLNLPSRKNKKISDAHIEINVKGINVYKSKQYKFKYGKELFELYMDLLNWYTPDTKKKIKKLLLKKMLTSKK